MLEEARGQRLDPARKGTARECEDSCGFWEPGDRRNGRARRSELAGLLRPLGRRAPDERGDPRPRAVADLQVFRETRGLRVGDPVELRDEMLSVVLGAGLLGKIYDGLQNPLPELARQWASSSMPGVYIHGLSWITSGILPQWPSRVTSSWRGPAGHRARRGVHPPDHGPAGLARRVHRREGHGGRPLHGRARDRRPGGADGQKARCHDAEAGR